MNHACFFAHYDSHDVVDATVLRQLKAIGEAGFEIVFVSTSALGEAERAKLAPLCREVVLRENRGLDFGSWALAFARYGASVGGELLLANNSVYGPFGDLGRLVERLRALPSPIRGLVESRQIAPHLQSWFVLFSPAAHRSAAFAALFGQDFAEMTKQEIIERGEIALSRRMAEAGFATSALFSDSHPGIGKGFLSYNPTHQGWRSLIEIWDIPFIKVELLRDNPVSVADLGAWRQVVGSRGADWPGLIEAHLRRTGGCWAGERFPHSRASLLSDQRFLDRHLALHRRGMHRAGLAHFYAQRLLAWSRHYVFALRHYAEKGLMLFVAPKYLSEAGRKLENAWLGEGRAETRGRAAIVAHVFHPELLPEILELKAALPPGSDLHVTTPPELADPLRAALAGEPGATVHPTPNRGRDIAPFISLLNAGVFDGYAAVLKVHTKKSVHLRDGPTRRRILYHMLAGHPARAARAVSLLESGKAGLAGWGPSYRRNAVYWMANRARVDRLWRAMGQSGPAPLGFFEGSMFWFSPAALEPLRKLGLATEDFEAEAGQLDGTLHHAVERAFTLSAWAAGFKVVSMRGWTLRPLERS